MIESSDPDNEARKNAYMTGGVRALAAHDAPALKPAVAVTFEDMQALYAAATAEGSDPHKILAAKMYGVPREEVTPEMRTQAKLRYFGAYGGMHPVLVEPSGFDAAAMREALTSLEGWNERQRQRELETFRVNPGNVKTARFQPQDYYDSRVYPSRTPPSRDRSATAHPAKKAQRKAQRAARRRNR